MSEPSQPESTDKLVKELEALRVDNEKLRGQLEQKNGQSNRVDIPQVSI